MDSRYRDLAETIIGFSTDVQSGENVLIDAHDTPPEMTVALIRAVRERGGVPFAEVHTARVTRELLKGATDEQYKLINEISLARMQQMQAYVGIRGSANIFESSDVPSEKMKLAMRHLRETLNHRVRSTKWCVLRWPSPSMAQLARMSTEEFEDYYFRVCTLDYARMQEGMANLKARFDACEQVHITGPGTDLKFSLKGLEALTAGGKHNLPDGEVFSAPVKESVQGEVTYNAPTVYEGEGFDDIRLVFKDGKVVETACSGNKERLDQILDSDPGARYVGEFAIGFNPHITEPIRDILFDEKIAGSFHFTPGQAYEGVADNGNRSQVHWDIVCIQRPEYGGGEIHFDGELIRKDGLFVSDDLQKLNPEYLLNG